ncbi:MAG: hypothetical protein J6D36_06880 [Erysipelotrichaceae bacterium]|nr:hypothetical protein [Erysipelotrichaceae bacterium]
MRNIIQQLKIILGVMAMTFFLAISPIQASAYTQEQKQAAKAWLSSHGYPATEDGAWQAYSDWLDGKWWDEFGSPDEYFGADDADDEEEEEGEAIIPATQKADEENVANSKEEKQETSALRASEASTEKTSESAENKETEAESAVSTTEPTSIANTEQEEVGASVQKSNIQEIVNSVSENSESRTKTNFPFIAIEVIAAVGIIIAIMLSHRKR